MPNIRDYTYDRYYETIHARYTRLYFIHMRLYLCQIYETIFNTYETILMPDILFGHTHPGPDGTVANVRTKERITGLSERFSSREQKQST